MSQKIIVGSRGSDLALTQTKWVIRELEQLHPDWDIELKVIHTSGDKDRTTELHRFQDLGVFVKELQIALIQKEIDIAVHSLKDVPEGGPEELDLVCFPEREDARDVFLSLGPDLMDLPKGAKVGTGSPRRVMQLRKLRPDLSYVAVRGNLDTRIGKVETGELDGILLAAAGLNRLGLVTKDQKKLKDSKVSVHSFSFEQMIPAIGQGCLALECRLEDVELQEKLLELEDPITRDSILLERDFMEEMGGGCKVPMACHVYPSGEGFRMMAIVGHPEKDLSVRFEKTATWEDQDELLEDVVWNVTEMCKEKEIPLPKDVPEHTLLEHPFMVSDKDNQSASQ
jgi:hydroxymethylbilane synthase